MDKVRAFLRATWQQRFWVLSVVGTLVAFACWMKASGGLDAEFNAHKSTIEGKFKDMASISGASVHGNPDVNARETLEAKKIRDGVVALWSKLYDAQRKDVLNWPDVLGKDFLAKVEKLTFKDFFPAEKRNALIPVDMRGRYWNYIKNRFDTLVEIVSAKKQKDITGGGAYGGREGADMSQAFEQPDLADSRGGREGGEYGGRGGAVEPEEHYIVQWLDQGDLRTKLDPPQQPTPLQIWVTQEDLWVYETLLHAIAHTNEARGSTRPDNAAIRGIAKLEVGQEAATASLEKGNIMLPAAAAAAPGAEGSGREGPRMGPGEGRGESAEGANPDTTLLSYRYVDKDGKPITDDSGNYGVEYRRLPVRMVLWMDQRWIPKILVECANASLPVEVTRVRINGLQSGAGFDSTIGGAAGASPGGREGGGEYRGGRGGGESAMAAPTGPGVSEYATVEIQGLVYIYNQPDQSALEVPGGEETPSPAVATTGPAVVR